MLKRHLLVLTPCLGCLALPSQATSLHQAVRARDRASLEMHLEARAGSTLDQPIAGGITALHLAAATDQAEIASLLIARGASVNAASDTGFTPLHWAASRDAADTIKVLVMAGGGVNARAQNNITPLHWAATKNATQAVHVLIEAGADLAATTDMGYTALHLAIRKNPYSETAVLLAQARARIEEAAGLLPADDLPDLPDPQAQDAAAGMPELPDAALASQAVLPGMFLSVPIGLGDALSFVWLDNPGIWFGKYEITNNRYRRYNPAHGSRGVEGITLDDPDQPVVYVSWFDAMEFCAWLNATFGSRIPRDFEFRLPTEAEWMIAAGAGDSRIYPWGHQWPPLYGNFSDLTARRHLAQWRGIEGYDDGYAATAPVQDGGMNELGIFGLAGNVWEWTLDWMDPETQQFKIRKGGSWDFDEQEDLRIIARGLDRPTARYDTIGFRIVVAPKRP